MTSINIHLSGYDRRRESCYKRFHSKENFNRSRTLKVVRETIQHGSVENNSNLKVVDIISDFLNSIPSDSAYSKSNADELCTNVCDSDKSLEKQMNVDMQAKSPSPLKNQANIRQSCSRTDTPKIIQKQFYSTFQSTENSGATVCQNACSKSLCEDNLPSKESVTTNQKMAAFVPTLSERVKMRKRNVVEKSQETNSASTNCAIKSSYSSYGLDEELILPNVGNTSSGNESPRIQSLNSSKISTLSTSSLEFGEIDTILNGGNQKYKDGFKTLPLEADNEVAAFAKGRKLFLREGRVSHLQFNPHEFLTCRNTIEETAVLKKKSDDVISNISKLMTNVHSSSLEQLKTVAPVSNPISEFQPSKVKTAVIAHSSFKVNKKPTSLMKKMQNESRSFKRNMQINSKKKAHVSLGPPKIDDINESNGNSKNPILKLSGDASMSKKKYVSSCQKPTGSRKNNEKKSRPQALDRKMTNNQFGFKPLLKDFKIPKLKSKSNSENTEFRATGYSSSGTDSSIENSKRKKCNLIPSKNKIGENSKLPDKIYQDNLKRERFKRNHVVSDSDDEDVGDQKNRKKEIDTKRLRLTPLVKVMDVCDLSDSEVAPTETTIPDDCLKSKFQPLVTNSFNDLKLNNKDASIETSETSDNLPFEDGKTSNLRRTRSRYKRIIDELSDDSVCNRYSEKKDKSCHLPFRDVKTSNRRQTRSRRKCLLDESPENSSCEGKQSTFVGQKKSNPRRTKVKKNLLVDDTFSNSTLGDSDMLSETDYNNLEFSNYRSNSNENRSSNGNTVSESTNDTIFGECKLNQPSIGNAVNENTNDTYFSDCNLKKPSNAVNEETNDTGSDDCSFNQPSNANVSENTNDIISGDCSLKGANQNEISPRTFESSESICSINHEYRKITETPLTVDNPIISPIHLKEIAVHTLSNSNNFQDDCIILDIPNKNQKTPELVCISDDSSDELEIEQVMITNRKKKQVQTVIRDSLEDKKVLKQETSFKSYVSYGNIQKDFNKLIVQAANSDDKDEDILTKKFVEFSSRWKNSGLLKYIDKSGGAKESDTLCLPTLISNAQSSSNDINLHNSNCYAVNAKESVLHPTAVNSVWSDLGNTDLYNSRTCIGRTSLPDSNMPSIPKPPRCIVCQKPQPAFCSKCNVNCCFNSVCMPKHKRECRR